MRNRRYILDVLNAESDGMQRTHSGFTTRAWPTDTNVNVFYAHFGSGSSRLVRSDLRSEWR